jgi:two-component system, sensor histidine kinase and response regulator
MITHSILVVDDEPDNFETIEAILSDESYQLHYANSGTSAIAALDRYDPDLILLDVMMPEQDGFETCEAIKSLDKWKAVPIVMVTALSGKTNMARCFSVGADDFVAKPIDRLELQARVHSMLRIKKQYDKIDSLYKLQKQNLNYAADRSYGLSKERIQRFINEIQAPIDRITKDLESSLEIANTLDRDLIVETIATVNSSISELKESISGFADDLDQIHSTITTGTL